MDRWIWSGLIAAGLAYETKVLKQGKPEDSFSAFTRSTFRTQTKPGKIAFCLGWGALSVWFIPHIVREVNASILTIIEEVQNGE